MYLLYRKSDFNIETSVNGKHFLFNTLSGIIVELTSSEYDLWTSDFELLQPDIKLSLVSSGFLTESVDEHSDVYNKYVQTVARVPDTIYFKILTTTRCNANCSYCFEKSYERKDMSVDVSDAVSDYILNVAKTYSSIELGWFGGEPLLNISAIDRIISNIRSKTDKPLKSEITTNGSLINQSLVDRMLEWNVYNVQITLDGTRDRYNEIKAYNCKKYNFDSIIDNIELLSENGIRVVVRINYSDETIHDVVDLINYLRARFVDRIRVYCSPIFSTDGLSPVSDESENVIFKALCQAGYLNPRDVLRRRNINCGLASCKDYAVIDPSGNLFKCCEAMVCPDYSLVGNVWDGITRQELVDWWSDLLHDVQCKSCTYLPMCLEGCRCSHIGINNAHCFFYKAQVIEALKMVIANTIVC